MSGLLLLLRTV